MKTSESTKEQTLATTGLNGSFFASVTVQLSSLEPETVLANPPSSVRGFWQSGPHWIAYAGSVAEIDSRERHHGTQRTLFQWVSESAEKLYESNWVLDRDGDLCRPRLHGGMAFDRCTLDDAAPGFWEVFPEARFTLPAFEVEADGSGARLTVTRQFPEDMPRDQAIDALRHRASRTRKHLLELERKGGVSSAVPSATALAEPVGVEFWSRGVNRILKEIAGGNVRKVVLARPLDVTLAEVPDSVSVLAALRTANPLSHVYLRQFARDRFLLGAAPELICSLHDDVFHTMAVGGSTPRGADPESDGWLGRQLLGSHKNRVEHTIVVEDIIKHLSEVGINMEELPAPALLRLPRIQHLRTDLHASVPSETSIISLIEALHPTAAVCGEPGTVALDILNEEESVGRGWYAGPVGWFDAAGNGEFAPALRSAVCRGPLLRLFAGSGIVSGSRPLAEWDETRVKFQTMLDALGVARVP